MEAEAEEKRTQDKLTYKIYFHCTIPILHTITTITILTQKITMKKYILIELKK